LANFQVERPPVGLVELTTFPALSYPTHNDADGHVIAVSTAARSMLATDHPDGPAAGSVELATVPALSYPTHSFGKGHDALTNELVVGKSSSPGGDQVSDTAPSAGTATTQANNAPATVTTLASLEARLIYLCNGPAGTK
jgi:hypothetical protein